MRAIIFVDLPWLSFGSKSACPLLYDPPYLLPRFGQVRRIPSGLRLPIGTSRLESERRPAPTTNFT